MCLSADKDSANDTTLKPALEGYTSRGRTALMTILCHELTHKHLVLCTCHTPTLQSPLPHPPPLAPPHSPLPYLTHTCPPSPFPAPTPCPAPLTFPCPALFQSLQTAPAMVVSLKQWQHGPWSPTPSRLSHWSSSSVVCRPSTHSHGCAARGPRPPGTRDAAA